MEYTATLRLYTPSIRERIGNIVHRVDPDISPDRVIIFKKGKWSAPIKSCRKTAGSINFEDDRDLETITKDFSKKFADGGFAHSNDVYLVDIPLSQRGMIREAFVGYFSKNFDSSKKGQ